MAGGIYPEIFSIVAADMELLRPGMPKAMPIAVIMLCLINMSGLYHCKYTEYFMSKLYILIFIGADCKITRINA